MKKLHPFVVTIGSMMDSSLGCIPVLKNKVTVGIRTKTQKDHVERIVNSSQGK